MSRIGHHLDSMVTFNGVDLGMLETDNYSQT
jgi:hypothetical protein